MKRFDLEAVQDRVADLVDHSRIYVYVEYQWTGNEITGKAEYRYLHMTIGHDERAGTPAATLTIWETLPTGHFDRMGRDCVLTSRVWAVLIRISELMGD